MDEAESAVTEPKPHVQAQVRRAYLEAEGGMQPGSGCRSPGMAGARTAVVLSCDLQKRPFFMYEIELRVSSLSSG